ncbi:hypothetical protein CSKR_202947, partial [Clonorchis sinensis]
TPGFGAFGSTCTSHERHITTIVGGPADRQSATHLLAHQEANKDMEWGSGAHTGGNDNSTGSAYTETT